MENRREQCQALFFGAPKSLQMVRASMKLKDLLLGRKAIINLLLLLLLSCFSRVGLCATPWTVAYQAPQSMEFSRQEYWSGLSFPSPGNLPNPGIEPRSPALQADALLSEPPGKP